MKRIVIFVLLLCVAFSASGCNQKTNDLSDKDPITEYDNIEEISVDDLRGTFTVKKKQLKYNDHNVEILRVENHTEYDCYLEIEGVFKSTEGETIKEESYKFRGLSAGDANYVVFNPAISYSDFSYKIEVRENDAPSYSKDFKFATTGSATAPEKPSSDIPAYLANIADMPTVRFQSNYSGTEPLYISAIIVIFDNKGEITVIDKYSGSGKTGAIDRVVPVKCNKDGDNYILPDNLTGGLSVLVAITEISEKPI